MGDGSLEFPTLYDDLHSILREWSTIELPPRMAYLSLYQTYVRRGASPQEATRQILDTALEQLALSHPLHAEILKRRFQAGMTSRQVAVRLNLATSTLYAKQREAITQLVTLVIEMERVQHRLQEELFATRLPHSPPRQLVGIGSTLAQLMAQLAAPDEPGIICIEGLGGIGKTTLADALVRQAVRQSLFGEFAWVSAKPSVFHMDGSLQTISRAAMSVGELADALLRQVMGSAVAKEIQSTDEALRRLQALFRAQRHLVVIDNLETLLDVEVLLPALSFLAIPTTFILTSRKSFFAETLYHFAVPPLTEQDALLLFRHEARVRNLPVLTEIGSDAFEAIYGTVGGNPLAIRLVVGLAHVYQVDVILNDLTAARGEAVENLYSFIYRRAWDSLSEPARQVLLGMPLVTDAGGRWEQLGMISRLDAALLRQALMELVSLNLVDARGTPNARRYTIHNLTRTFLHTQVAGWK